MDDELERMLATLRDRADRPEPSPGLMARVLADGYAHQPVVVPMRRARVPVWRQWLAAGIAALGGTGVMAGLGAATMAGVLIGYASPPAANWVTQGLSVSATEVQMLPADDLFLTEG